VPVPPGQRLSVFSDTLICHPDQVSEAQAGANAQRDQREAMCLKTCEKKEIPFGFAQGSGPPALIPRLRPEERLPEEQIDSVGHWEDRILLRSSAKASVSFLHIIAGIYFAKYWACLCLRRCLMK